MDGDREVPVPDEWPEGQEHDGDDQHRGGRVDDGREEGLAVDDGQGEGDDADQHEGQCRPGAGELQPLPDRRDA